MKTYVILFATMLMCQSVEMLEPNQQPIDVFQDVSDDVLEMTEWEDIFIKDIHINDYERLKPQLKQQYDMVELENKQLYKNIYTPTVQQERTVNVEIRANVHKRNNEQVKLQIVFSGHNWNKQEKQDYTYLSKQLQKIYDFTNGTNFSCAKLNVNGIISDGKLRDDLIEKLQIVQQEEKYDNVAQSSYTQNIYGKSARFHQSLKVSDKAINIQIALKELQNQKKQVILGTPIILNEY